jgi:hypothetical protein
MINPEDYRPDPDDLTRAELAELAHLPWADVANVLDEWNRRTHGVLSSHHGVGLFLDLLNEAGWHLVRNEPPIVLPPPTD